MWSLHPQPILSSPLPPSHPHFHAWLIILHIFSSQLLFSVHNLSSFKSKWCPVPVIGIWAIFLSRPSLKVGVLVFVCPVCVFEGRLWTQGTPGAILHSLEHWPPLPLLLIACRILCSLQSENQISFMFWEPTLNCRHKKRKHVQL